MTVDKKVNSSVTSLATKRLREAHADEFRELKFKAAAELGLDYTPRKTKAEVARATLAALLKDYPDLRAELVSEIEKGIHQEAPDAVATVEPDSFPSTPTN